MKKLICLLALVIAGGFSMKAQKPLTVAVGSNVCLDKFEIVFNDGSNQGETAGCTGMYVYTLASDVAYIIVNDVKCPFGAETKVTLSSGDPVTIRQITTADGPRYIVKADGVIYDK